MKYPKVFVFLEVMFAISMTLTLAMTFLIKHFFNYLDCDFFLSTLDNWSFSPIVNISSTSYKEEPIDYWPGSYQSCECFGRIGRGVCINYKSLCTNYKEVPPFPFKVWKSTPFYIERYSKPLSNLTLVNKVSSCPNSYINCGIIDSLQNYMCVPPNEPCPINDFLVVNDLQLIPKGYSVIRLGTSEMLGFGNKGSSGKIAVNFKISEGPPCTDSFFFNRVTIPHPIEVMVNRDKCLNRLGGFFIDPSYTSIDTYSKANLLAENTKNDLVRGKINLINCDYTLYYRGYLGLEPGIRSSLTVDNIKTIKEKIQVYKNNVVGRKEDFILEGYRWRVLASYVFIALTYFLLRNVLFRLKRLPRDLCENQLTTFIFEFIAFGSSLSHAIVFSIIHNSTIGPYKGAFDDIVPIIGKGDSVFNEYSDDKVSTWNRVFSYSVVALVFSYLALFLSIISFVFKCFIDNPYQKHIDHIERLEKGAIPNYNQPTSKVVQPQIEINSVELGDKAPIPVQVSNLDKMSASSETRKMDQV